MKNILFLALGVLLFAACSDPDKDPLQFDKITKGAIIALRGDAFDNLSNGSYRGAVDSFSISNPDLADKNFDFQADFLAEDVNSLSKVEVYASATDGGARVRILTKDGADFKPVSDSKYPRASFSIPTNDILAALNLNRADIPAYSYLYIECDITLKDGTVVPASAITNGNLYESALFYPAHFMRFLAGY
ncbi:MAG: hypothetical protein IT269_13080 [Saprospiraceae bacterium]|nr:hypothetical protein [Saprospiraceae bacterium]